MYRKEVNQSSPLRILERSIRGGLGPGNLGVVMARAGVGKTAFLVQVGLDNAMREGSVLHVALDQTLEQALGWYEALFRDLEQRTRLENPHAVREIIARQRIIQAFTDRHLSPKRLRKVIDLYAGSLEFKPTAVIIDGYDWNGPGERRAELMAFKEIAGALDAELWLGAQTHREQIPAHPTALVPPCDAVASLIDVAVFLEPKGQNVSVRLLKDHAGATPSDVPLELDPDTLRLIGGAADPVRLPLRSYTLLSGGAQGAETAFGEAAERWGVSEVHFSYAGRTPARTVGLVELSDAELHAGEVSIRYVESHMQRSFPDSSEFHRLLQSIWHHVATAAQVFIIGEIQADDTVRGGTGWGAELARHLGKELYVFDDERGGWHNWCERNWDPCDPPRITHRRFCGGGTRNVDDADRAAIEALFAASFGPTD